MTDFITYESPLELLLETQAEIEKDIEWLASRPDAKHTTLKTLQLKQLRLKFLKASNREYTAAIEKLLEAKN